MVKITKGGKITDVPMSAFVNYFKAFGWEIVGEGYTPPIPVKEEKQKKVEKAEENDQDDQDEWDDVLDELQDDEAEKPISEMNRAELIEKAKSMKIDVSKLNTNKQLREAIKSCM